MRVLRTRLLSVSYSRACHPLFSSYAASRSCSRASSSSSKVDAQCIPTHSTWSVNDLLASFPRPTIPSQTLERMHVLSALVPPAIGTEEHRRMTRGLENLVKLVEAVKLVDTQDVEGPGRVPDGRVWPDGVGIDLSNASQDSACGVNVDGRTLLEQAARTANGLYVVEADKHRSQSS